MCNLFQRRIRGFRLVEVVALGVLLATILMVYLAKTGAGRENADIVLVEDQIQMERERLRLLSAEVAFLEQPERIERLSSLYLGMGPIASKRETPAEALPALARAAEPPAPTEPGRATP